MLHFRVARFNLENPECETAAALIRQPDAKSQVERRSVLAAGQPVLQQQRLVQGLTGQSKHGYMAGDPAGTSRQAGKLFPNN